MGWEEEVAKESAPRRAEKSQTELLAQIAGDIRWFRDWIIRGAVISLCLTVAGAMLPFCAM